MPYRQVTQETYITNVKVSDSFRFGYPPFTSPLSANFTKIYLEEDRKPNKNALDIDIPKDKADEKANIDNVTHNEPDRYESSTQQR